MISDFDKLLASESFLFVVLILLEGLLMFILQRCIILITRYFLLDYDFRVYVMNITCIL